MQQGFSYNKTVTVEHVRNKWLCHGCGMCSTICKLDAIQMIYDRNHRNYVPLVDDKRCSGCKTCLSICPGMKVSFGKISERFLEREKYHILSGSYIKNYLAWSANKEIRWKAASGGIATTLAAFILETGQAEKVVVVRPTSRDRPLDFQGISVDRVSDLYSAMGSKYCPVPVCVALKHVSEKERTVFVGLPCHIQAIRKAQLNDKAFSRRNIILLGLFCGGTRGKEATTQVLKKHGFSPDELIDINYRCNGWPGFLVAQFSDGKKISLPYPSYSDLQFNSFRPWRCGLCSDGLAELADISIGDAWLQEVVSKDSQGVSIIVVRSHRGEGLLKQAVSNGVIQAIEADDGDAIRSQHRMLVRKKYGIAGSMMVARVIARGTPEYDNVAEMKIPALPGAILSRLKEEILCGLGRASTKYSLLESFLSVVRSGS